MREPSACRPSSSWGLVFHVPQHPPQGPPRECTGQQGQHLPAAPGTARGMEERQGETFLGAHWPPKFLTPPLVHCFVRSRRLK